MARPTYLSVEEARRLLLRVAPGPVAEEVPLLGAAGRVLAADVVAEEDVPAFARSHMDGFAVRAADLAGASQERPVRLRLAGAAAAGHLSPVPAGPGEAVAVATGAPIPAGADAVIPFERTRSGEGWVEALAAVAPGEHVGPRGEDMAAGALPLARGALLTPAAVGVLAALGRVRVPVYARPRVAILPTGDEVVDPAVQPGPAQVRNSTAHALAAAFAGAGALPQVLPQVDDDPEAIATALERLGPAPFLATTGGVSVGRYDLVERVLENMGAEVLFWRVAMKPGRNLLVARRGEGLVLAFSGNPAAALIAFDAVVRPAVLAAGGLPPRGLARARAVLDEGAARLAGLRRFLRIRLRRDGAGGPLRAAFVGSQLAGVLSSLALAHGYAVIPEGEGRLEPGAEVDVLLLPGVEGEFLGLP